LTDHLWGDFRKKLSDGGNTWLTLGGLVFGWRFVLQKNHPEITKPRTASNTTSVDPEMTVAPRDPDVDPQNGTIPNDCSLNHQSGIYIYIILYYILYYIILDYIILYYILLYYIILYIYTLPFI
jgi:hypothetical protein